MKRFLFAVLTLALLATGADAHGYGRFHGGYGRSFGYASAFYATPFVPQTYVYTYAIPVVTTYPVTQPVAVASPAPDVTAAPAVVAAPAALAAPVYNYATVDYGSYATGCNAFAYGGGYSNFYGRGFRGHHFPRRR